MNKSLTVTQDFNLVNAKYKLNTSEVKFILTALTQLDSKQDEILREYEIKVSDLEKKLQVEQNSTRLKQFAKKLMSKPLEVPTDSGWIVFNWFSKIQYCEKERLFRVRIEEDLKPYLLQLKERFVTYNLQNILPLTSTYSVRIYQLLKEYEKLKKRYFDVVELQEILQVPKSLKVYADFKRKVLRVAERELLQHTDIFFDFEEVKEGRRVVKLIFRIQKNNWKNESKQAKLFETETPENYSELYGIDCRVNEKKCEHLLVITPMTNGTITCLFRSGENYNFRSVESLLKHKI